MFADNANATLKNLKTKKSNLATNVEADFTARFGATMINMKREKGNEMKTDEYKFFKKGYLLLRRKEGQGFFIDKDTEVVIAKIEGDKVYVAIKAPNKRVVREEIASKEPRKPEVTT